MRVIGVDPGADTGIAVIENGVLVDAWLGNPKPARFDEVYIECPRIYPTGTPNPNDLIKLAVIVGEYKEWYSYRCNTVHLIAPSDWKAQLPKEITMARMLAKYPNLKTFLEPFAKSKRHNIADACGIADYGSQRV